ncbi:hypothetical protein AVEN_162174-1 [Araneus ventricosus]|uniref:Uncharacterized protein n=1 Tax=Araneus ventricosus TaxID=182803 RepID=A0A4Y2GZ47_ARAVE|nr:hypothetical protein AVEN_162174-1 [Araneus ventricosus]
MGDWSLSLTITSTTVDIAGQFRLTVSVNISGSIDAPQVQSCPECYSTASIRRLSSFVTTPAQQLLEQFKCRMCLITRRMSDLATAVPHLFPELKEQLGGRTSIKGDSMAVRPSLAPLAATFFEGDQETWSTCQKKC